MSCNDLIKDKISNNTNTIQKNESKDENFENNIKFIRRTLENNTHIVFEDTKFKSITSWRKSQKKFLQNFIFNILSFGLLHIISLHYPKLYIKLYCNPWPPKECDFFLIENIYGQFTLCTKIHKKSKNNNNSYFNSDIIKENTISSNMINYKNKIEYYLLKNLTYSFKYKSITYEYNEETNEINPIYMDLTKLTKKDIFNFFSEGLSTENLMKKFEERYGKNEYYINQDFQSFYFKKIESVYLISILIIQSFNIFFKDYTIFIIYFIIIALLFFTKFIILKKMFYDLYKNEYTLDGEQKLKVKRKYKFVNDMQNFCEIKNCDLLPGDIIYLKSNDFVPCDCIILEGECVVNSNNLTGSLDIFKKISLDNNNEKFNYKVNKINILYHGMKIMKTFSKLKDEYIAVLCINTGPNTYKANQYTNIAYLLERKKIYKNMREFLGNGRKYMVLIILFTFLISVSTGIIFPFSVNHAIHIDIKNINLFLISLLRVVTKSCMPAFFLTNSIIYFMGIFYLKKKNILCFEKSTLINAGNIDTIFISKTGILCENNFEINGFHPIYINPHRPNIINYISYTPNEYKEMNLQLLKYYKDYLIKNQNNNNNFNQEFNLRHGIKINHSQINIDKITRESCECTTLFLECLLSCHNLEKYNTDIFGNSLEADIFKNMKWDIKSHRFNNDLNFANKNNNNENLYSNQLNNNKYYFDSKFNLVDKNISDIYPNNYYKITESIKNEMVSINKPILTRFNSKYYFEQMNKKNITDNISEFSYFQNISNFIKNDISGCNIISYKLRIYKRFIKNGTLISSSIVYNFITRELKFMTKGIPEDIIDKCDSSTLPDNFDNIISLYRRRGLIVIVCASKLINIDDYKDSDTIDDYMNNLTFCGFITLKNKLKKEILNSIKDLKRFNCNLIVSTGDNIYNSLPIAFDSKIIDNKNIFVFDKDPQRHRILISKIHSSKKINESDQEENDKKTQGTSVEKISKYSSSQNKNISPFLKSKESYILNSNILRKKTNEGIDKNGNNYENKLNKNYYMKGNNLKRIFLSKIKMIYGKNYEDEKNQKYSIFSTNSDIRNMKTNSRISNISYLNLEEKNAKIYNKKLKNKFIDNNKELDSINKKLIISNELKSKTLSKFSNLEKNYYYPGIFEDYEELNNNCFYCISGAAFNFLYQNKDKKQCKKILEKIHKNCKIFFSMSSLDKSLVIDYYREYPNSCICTVGKYQNDFDAMMTSNVGICLEPPKNENTILFHYFCENSNLLSIKTIIREGRAINENLFLLKITCCFFTLIINSFIVCYFLFKVDINLGQLNFLEIWFLILSISGFTIQYDNNVVSNSLIENKKLNLYYYFFKIIGVFAIKISITIFL